MNPILNNLFQQAKNNPAIANNPMAQNCLSILESGDAKRGEEMANNLLQSYGISKEDALNQARSFFHI